MVRRTNSVTWLAGVCVALGVALFAGYVVRSSDSNEARSARLEYRAITRTDLESLSERKDSGLDGMRVAVLVDGLNKLATDGWELVAIEPAHSYSEKTYAPATIDGKVDSNAGLRGITVSYPVTYIFKIR